MKTITLRGGPLDGQPHTIQGRIPDIIDLVAALVVAAHLRTVLEQAWRQERAVLFAREDVSAARTRLRAVNIEIPRANNANEIETKTARFADVT